jgi:hypothetical protein
VSGLRDWVIRTLKVEFAEWPNYGNEFTFEGVGSNGLRVMRRSHQDARVYCAGIDQGKTFELADLDRACSNFDGVQFVVVVPRRIAHAVYARAEDLRLCVDGFPQLISALLSEDNVSLYRSNEHHYVMRRLCRNRSVKSVRRIGSSAFEVKRFDLSTVTIATIDRYELTADDIYTLVEEYADLGIQAIAITNPNASGISTDALKAGAQTGIRVILFQALLNTLG